MLGSQARPARPAAQPSAPSHAEAYHSFLMGRLLEGEGDTDGALAALKRASELDPSSAEIKAELAGFYARQNRPDEAVAAAQAALAIEPDSAEANYVIGSVYAAYAQREDAATTADQAIANIDKAIEHLERARVTRQYDLGISLTLGRLYLARSRDADAEAVLRRLVEEEPGIPEAHWLLAQAYETLGQRARAVAALQDTVSLEPRFARAWIRLGELAEGDGRWNDAAEAFQEAAQQSPHDPQLRLRQAQALINGGRAASARDLLREIAKASPADPGTLYLLSVAERNAGDLDAAQSTAERLTTIAPTDVRGTLALADVHSARYDDTRAVSVLEAAIGGLGPQSSALGRMRLLTRLGLAWQRLGDYDKAIDAFERARAAGSPGDVEPYLAQAYLAAGKPEKALELVSAAREHGADEVMLVRLEAQALGKANRHDEAIARLQSLLPAHETSVEVIVALAAAQADATHVDDALATLERADARFKDNPELPFRRGAILEEAKRYEDAEQAFREAIRRDPLHDEALNYLGYMLAERGQKLEEATTLIERALDVEPGNPSYLDSLGWAWFKRGDLQKARQQLSSAADRAPHNSAIQAHLGDVLAALGDSAAAVAAWDRAIAGDGESVDRESLRQKIAHAKGR